MPIQPLISFTEEGKPLSLLHSMPEPTQFRFTQAIKCGLDKSVFKNLPGQPGEDPFENYSDADSVSEEAVTHDIDVAIGGPFHTGVLTGIRGGGAFSPLPAPGERTITTARPAINTDVMKTNIKNGRGPYLTTTKTGKTKVDYVDREKKYTPGLHVLCKLKMTNFLGDYGAGRIIQTLSLLPKEETEIYIRTYKDISSKTTESQSLFDSYSEEVEDSFSEQLQEESGKDSSLDAGVSAEFHAQGPMVGGSVEAYADTSLEKSARTFSDVTTKHSSKVSSKRDVTVNTSSEFTSSEGVEDSIKRTIENPNSDHVVNYVFRQINQKHMAVLHLTDIKVCFFNGYQSTRMEVELSELDSLLEYCIKDEGDRVKAKEYIASLIKGLKDHKKNPHPDLVIESGDELKFNYDKEMQVGDLSATVPGMILNLNEVVMRTEGVVVDSLVAPSTALSEYTVQINAQRLQEITNRNRLSNVEIAIKQKLLAELREKEDLSLDQITQIMSSLSGTNS